MVATLKASSSFLKKRTRKLSRNGCDLEERLGQTSKSFLLIFFKKEALAFLCASIVAAPQTLAATPVKIANFGFDMVNTSPTPTTPEETARLNRLGTQLADMLQKSGRYDVVDTAKAAAALHGATNGIRDCNGCELPDAVKAGASQAVYGWVQKVSNLILNVNLVIEDAKTGKQVAGGSVDIRGNTDDSWDRGLHFLLEEHVLPQ